MPNLRWIHRIKHPGCSGVRNGLSAGSEIPSCVESEVSVSSYTDFFVRDRAEDNCAGRGAKAIYHYCLTALMRIHLQEALDRGYRGALMPDILRILRGSSEKRRLI